ncbi:tetratricopeptide repeat protein [bacterium]|nr:tetratricopeptide repeat protein [candidate division CSSED10-310 bacterium]
MNRFRITFFIFLMNFVAGVYADPESLYGFGVFLESEGDYFRAVTEYKRYLYLYPEEPRIFECRFRIGRCYVEENDYFEAMKHFTELINTAPNLDWAQIARYSLSEVFYRQNSYQQSLHELSLLKRAHINHQRVFSIEYSEMWCHLRKKQIEEAVSVIRNGDWSQELNNVMLLENKIEELKRIPMKKPSVAGSLSAIFPGAGQLYCGRIRDSISSFLINGLFIGAIIYSANENHQSEALILGFFEISWYSANIYHAINLAYKVNENAYNRHLRYLERTWGKPYDNSVWFPD